MPRKIVLLIGLVALMAILATTLAIAQSGGAFDLTWSTIDGGGGSSSGGSYALSGTAGQPDAGVMKGGAYTLGGGFWKGAGQTYDYKVFDKVYLPVIFRNR